MRVVIALNSSWNFWNFRSGLIKSLVSAGHSVVLAAPADGYVEELERLGCRFVHLPVDSQGTNPAKDFLLILRLVKLMRAEKTEILVAYTVKPNVYGSIAARWIGIPVINNISGLGSGFLQGGWLTLVLRGLYSQALSKSKKIFFQNNDDRELFVSEGLVKEIQTDLIPGSGVDLARFKFSGLPCLRSRGNLSENPFCFLLIARMLKDKGIEEYVQAAKLIKSRFPKAEFALLGFLETKNPTAISKLQMQSWVQEGAVTYWGKSDDVRKEIVRADCIVLPSYREGTPRSLLEGAAMGRPLITTDVPGCREVVQHEFNGVLCRPMDVDDLAQKMTDVLMLTRETIARWGKNSRTIVEEKFDEKIVINKYLKAIDGLVNTPKR